MKNRRSVVSIVIEIRLLNKNVDTKLEFIQPFDTNFSCRRCRNCTSATCRSLCWNCVPCAAFYECKYAKIYGVVENDSRQRLTFRICFLFRDENKNRNQFSYCYCVSLFYRTAFSIQDSNR